MKYNLRPATEFDIEWLEPFYEKLMKPYVELTHKWDKTKFRKSYSPEQIKVIQSSNQDIGMFKVERRENYIYLGDIQIKSEFQRQGIGSQLINDLIEKAKSDNLPIRLKVLKGNRAIELYRRLGFVLRNELNYHYELEYRV